MLVLKDRSLLANGKSLITVEKAAEILFEKGELPDNYLVEDMWDTREYQMVYGKKVISGVFDDDIEIPDLAHTEDHLDELIDIVAASPRYNSKLVTRVETELDFFNRTFNILFLLRLHQMINEFKEKNVVWGVGRGSAVSSYVLYCLEVHDINPCEYGIPFHELSKEQ